MKIFIVHAHPEPQSFNTALFELSVGVLRRLGHEVKVSDLCAMDFNPVAGAADFTERANPDYLVYALEQRHGYENGTLAPDILAEIEKVLWCDLLILNFPLFWFSTPAILKGWIDRVIRPGVAYEFEDSDSGEGVPTGLLRARAALVFTTSNTYPERERSVFGDPLETIWKNCIFDLCGVKTFHRRNFEVIVTSTPEERREWLREAVETALRYFPPDN